MRNEAIQPTSTGNVGRNFLDQDSPDTVRMSPDEARRLGEGALMHLGYSVEDARIVVDQLVDNALCGYKFAGLPRILAIARDPRTSKARQPVRVVHQTPTSALLDGGNNVGYISAFRAAEIAVEKVRLSGMASVGVYNSFFSGRNAYFVEQIVKAGYIGMHVTSGEPKVLPPGGKRPALGTNPICFGFPSEHGPVIVDMGTSSLMWGDVTLHADLGLPLPEGVGFDSDGKPSRNAAEVLKGGVSTFGGHKGFGLSFAVQALGLLAGAALARGRVQDFGFLFWAVDPKSMLPQGSFEKQMSELVSNVKATPRQLDVDEIRIPSERAARERMRRLKEGIVLERKIVESLKAL